jgi:hypothetical protein
MFFLGLQYYSSMRKKPESFRSLVAAHILVHEKFRLQDLFNTFLTY